MAAALGFLALLAIAFAVLNSPIGHRFIVDRIARYAPASGLRVEIGRIEGTLYGAAVLRDVTLADPKGVFLRVPEVELDWRPFSWFSSGLDVRKLVAHRGTLLRVPKLNPGDPEAPILPNFDIRIDRLEIEDLKLAKGIVGDERRVDLTAKVDIRKGRAFIRTDARLGGSDRLFALLDAEPARNKFDFKFDYAAPKDGVLAGLAGATQDLRARVVGAGTWRDWRGALLAEQGGKHLAALQLTNRAGLYGMHGQIAPSGFLSGLPARAAGQIVGVSGHGTLQNSVLRGTLELAGQGLRASGGGTVDLANNNFQSLRIQAQTVGTGLLGPGAQLDNAQLTATLDGPFRDISAQHVLTARVLAFGTTRLEGLSQTGVARYDGARWSLPLALAARRIVTGNATIDPRLVNARASGTLALIGSRLLSDDLTIAVPGLGARLALRGDLKAGGYALAGPVAARGFHLPNLGLADANADIVFKTGNATPWQLSAKLAGRMTRVDNPTLTSLAGTGLRFGGNVSLGQNQPLLFERATLSGSKLSLGIAGRRLPDGRTTMVGRGRHADYGPFTLNASVAGDGPRAVLVFADPYPAAGLKDVRVALAPIKDGFRIETAGDSRLGPFTGTLGLFAQPGGPTRLAIERLEVWKTAVTGSLLLGRSAVTGSLALTGGGVDGAIRLAPRGGGQGFVVDLTAKNAQFGGANPLSIASARIDAEGQLVNGHSTITGNLFGEGIGQGRLFIGRLAAKARLVDGRGQVTAVLAGRRGSRFNLQIQSDVAPERIAVFAAGDFAGRKITMPRRAVLTPEQGGWRLAPTQLNFGGGRAIASGKFGGGGSDLNFALADMPLSLGDVLYADLGLGGTASGLVEYRAAQGSVPTGSARLQIKGLTRSGLVLTSRAVDLALVADLSATQLETRAVVREGGEVRGRVQGRIGGLPARGTLGQRINAGSLFAQLRYSGPADALWRLVALEAFDLTGPVSVAADASGTVANPQIRGSLASDNLRLQSALVGSDISGIAVRGRFAGSRLDLSNFAGKAAGGGTVSGSGSIDLSGLGTRGPAIDLRIAARNAAILARDDMAATVTGPLRIVSDGVNGTIAGRLAIDRARWQLGRATAAAALPTVRTREINLRGDIAPPRAALAPWRFLIDASGPGRVDVRGLGIDSEWGADIRIRGNTAAPQIYGEANLVRGGYEFAGKRFEMTKGRIAFDGGSPPNPRLDIAAEADVTGLNARVTVTGTSLVPVIAFTSVPALPEEELLARLLFGDSITDISAPEALQLGVALASLRGGGGIDPINKLRSAIGLDRLRIVSADAAIGRGTGVAAGKYLGRRFYAEIITDGRGYSATQLEFRVTNWLSLLASVSTIGRESVNVRVSKDY
ncbi:MAG TPA: translocation/assembly module TamB domain-containing protein [Novosphingobium sp.]|nr:translocation/assembly module TamB domain-containing protein [Novosphingobium sp.]